MRKAPEAFRTISEVAEILQTPAHVLRFWESKFSHVKPVKRAGGRRYYRPADVALLAGIRSLLHDQGMTIRGVQKMLTDKGTRHVAGLAPAAVVEVIGGEVDAEQLDGAVIDGEVTLSTPTEDTRDGGDQSDAAATDPAYDDAAETPDDADRSLSETPAPADTASDDTVPDQSEAETTELVEATPAAGEPETDEHETAETDVAASVAEDPAVADAAPDAAAVDVQQEPAVLVPRCLSSAQTIPGAAPPEGASDAVPPPATGARMAIRLRAVTPGAVAPHRSALGAAAKRLDALLDRMSDTSGVRRW